MVTLTSQLGDVPLFFGDEWAWLARLDTGLQNDLLAEFLDDAELTEFIVEGYVFAPTHAPPGTVEKMLVMFCRDAKNLEVHHPEDARSNGRDYRPEML